MLDLHHVVCLSFFPTERWQCVSFRSYENTSFALLLYEKRDVSIWRCWMAPWAKALSRLHEKRFQGAWTTQSLEAKLPFKSIATLKLTYFLAILSLTSFQLHAIDYCWIESRCSNRLLCFARFGYYADSFILSGGVFANSSSVRRNDKVFFIGGMDIIFYRMKSYERMKKTLFVWLYIQIRRRDLAGCSCGTLKIQVRTHFA